jgi:AraC family transcriptional activator FtrA
MHRIAVLALESVVAFDMATPAQVFRGPYAVDLCGLAPGPVPTSTTFAVVADHGLEALARADTVIVPGYDTIDRPPPAAALDALRAAHARGARTVSICTGAFALAHAGLLDGRRATTHWRFAPYLAERFPAVDVDPNVLYVDDGDVLTSAGSAAGLDLCLHLVRLDHGSRAAGTAARWSVVPPHRDGGQAQFVPTPVPEPTATPVGAWLDWARERLDEPIEVREWAAAVGTSPRTFARRFRDATGETPVQWLAAERVRRAQELLEGTDLPVEAVAVRCGFATAAGLRKHFCRRLGATPQQYRRTFRAGHEERMAG